MSVTSRQSQRGEPQPERRVQFNADELSVDILALLASCGQAVRKTDLPKVHSLLGSIQPARTVDVEQLEARLQCLPSGMPGLASSS